MKQIYLIVLLTMTTFSASSSEVAGVAAIESSLNLNQDNINFAEIGQWNLSIGLGIGKRSNPLFDGKDTPLYLLPAISYYGENIYFDDGVLGYSYEITPQLYVSIITQLNAHAANFSQWHPSNFLLSSSSEVITSPEFDKDDATTSITSDDVDNTPRTNEEVANTPISVSQLNKRHWALDAGIQVNYFTQQNIMLQLNLLTDISGIYNGMNGQLKLEKTWNISAIKPLSIKLSSSLDWYSDKLAIYYYGISDKDNKMLAAHYSPTNGNNITLGVTANYQLSNKWRAALAYRTTSLGTSITRSPMVQESQSNTFFIGAIYNF